MPRTLSRGRPPTGARRQPPGPLGHVNLRRACEAASVPLVDAEGWPIQDSEVDEAIYAACSGESLSGGALALQDAARAGQLPLGSRVLALPGPITTPEALVLASVLRSSAADAAARP